MFKKNYIIAFSLIILILIITNTKWYRENILHIKDKPVNTLSNTSKEIKDSLLLQDTTINKLSDTLKSNKDIKEKEILIKTQKYTLLFSNKGALIKKLVFNEYFDNSRKNNIVLFEKSKINSIKLDKNSDTILIYNIKIDSTDSSYILSFLYNDSLKVIEKKYNIPKNDYLIKVSLNIKSKNNIDQLSFILNGFTKFNDNDDKNYAAGVFYVNEELDQIKKSKSETINLVEVKNFWDGIRTKYFWGGMIFDFKDKKYSGEINYNLNINSKRKFINFNIDNSITLFDKNNINFSYAIIATPVDKYLLKKYGYGLSNLGRFGARIIQPLSDLILWITIKLYGFIPNWGLVIIIFTIFLKLILSPLNHKSMESSKKLQQVQPIIKSIQEKYKNDPKRMQMEMMKVYQQHGVNPFGGCLPILIQMPIFFALYSVFRGAFQFRQAEFILWIKDLSQPEVLFSIGPFKFGLIVFLSTVFMYIQMSMSIKDPKQKFMPTFMSVFMYFIFSNMSVGLNLYWGTYNLLSLIQQYWIERKYK